MKTLKCQCGRIRIGVPRRQKHCSKTCPYARAVVLATLAKIKAARTRQVNARIDGLSPREAFTIGYRAGWKRCHKRLVQRAVER